jgi:hypothetical protein
MSALLPETLRGTGGLGTLAQICKTSLSDRANLAERTAETESNKKCSNRPGPLRNSPSVFAPILL